MRQTFAQAFCASVGCASHKYLRVALKHCLYPKPRCCCRLFALFLSATDRQLLTDAGAATSVDQFNDLLREYRDDLGVHRGFLANRLKFSISTSRLEQLFNHVMRGETGPPRELNQSRLTELRTVTSTFLSSTVRPTRRRVKSRVRQISTHHGPRSFSIKSQLALMEGSIWKRTS